MCVCVMFDPPHCLLLLLLQLCLQLLDPPHCLHCFVRRLCGNFCSPLLHSASYFPRHALSLPTLCFLAVPPPSPRHASLPARTKDAFTSPQTPRPHCLETLPACVWSLSAPCLRALELPPLPLSRALLAMPPLHFRC